jgi:hypothetical protein
MSVTFDRINVLVFTLHMKHAYKKAGYDNLASFPCCESAVRLNVGVLSV